MSQIKRYSSQAQVPSLLRWIMNELQVSISGAPKRPGSSPDRYMHWIPLYDGTNKYYLPFCHEIEVATHMLNGRAWVLYFETRTQQYLQ